VYSRFSISFYFFVDNVDSYILVVIICLFIYCKYVIYAFRYAAECGGRLTEPSGSIQSALYPDRYHDNANCTWVITVPDEKLVKIRCLLCRLTADCVIFIDLLSSISQQINQTNFTRATLC